MRRTRHIKCGLLLIIAYIFWSQLVLLELFFKYFGHPKFVIVNPLDNLRPCHQRLAFKKRQSVDETEKSIDDLETLFGDLSVSGGRFRPLGCATVGRTAIIIPYRDRQKHLLQFLNNVLPKLLRQDIDFTIFIIEQAVGSNFNRGMLRNIGFTEAMKAGIFDCAIFNDVDTIIEDDRNIFQCHPNMVRHLVSSIDRFDYTMPYYTLIGGIIGFTKEQFQQINGYSNLFFLWGAEDDDLYRRIIDGGYLIERPIDPIGAVTTLKHVADPLVKARFDIYNSVGGYQKYEGLSSLNYKVNDYELRPLFTWINVDIDEDAMKKGFIFDD